MTVWRDAAAPIIAAIPARYPEDSLERRKALREAYPFGPRAHFPYKIWLDEIARQTGRKKSKPCPFAGQGSLLGGIMKVKYGFLFDGIILLVRVLLIGFLLGWRELIPLKPPPPANLPGAEKG